jgi:hypothetical protein
MLVAVCATLKGCCHDYLQGKVQQAIEQQLACQLGDPAYLPPLYVTLSTSQTDPTALVLPSPLSQIWPAHSPELLEATPLGTVLFLPLPHPQISLSCFPLRHYWAPPHPCFAHLPVLESPPHPPLVPFSCPAYLFCPDLPPQPHSLRSFPCHPLPFLPLPSYHLGPSCLSLLGSNASNLIT